MTITVSGREITFCRLCINDLWADVQEGSPEMLTKLVRRTLPARVQQGLGTAQPVQIFDDGEPVLPPFLCMAYLKSSAVKPGFFYSYAYVAWFAESLDADIPTLLQGILSRLDWNVSATDVHIDDV